MTQATSPDNIAKWTNSDPASIVQASQSQGDSVQNALSKRERYDFVWANASERTAQTGMVQGSRGYQVDTRSEYIFDNSNWRLAVPYAEYNNSGLTITSGVYSAFTNWTQNTTTTTDTAFTSVSTNVLTLVNPGVYAFTITTDGSPNSSGFVDFTMDVAHNQIISLSAFTSGVSTCVVPFYRATASNTLIYMWVIQTSGSNGTISSTATNPTVRLRVGRFG